MVRKREFFRSRTFILAALFIIPLAVYTVTLVNGFVGDDNHQVLGNKWITSARYIPEIFRSSVWSFVSGSPVSNYYRPMMHLTYMAAYYLFGLRPWGFHLVNIVLHALNTVLVFYTALYLFSARKDDVAEATPSGYLAPFIAAAVFALHPLNTEAVCWIASVPELTFTLFCLLAFNAYARSFKGTGDGTGLSLPLYAFSVIFFALALLCKETAIIFPALLVILDFSKKGVAFIRRIPAYVPFAVVAVAYLVVRTSIIGGVVHYKNIDLAPYAFFINIIPIIPRYVWRFVEPFPLTAAYVFHEAASPLAPTVVAAIAFWAVAAVAAVYFRKNRAVFVPMLWTFAALAPALYLPAVPGGFAERYFYLPSAGAAMLVAYVLKRAFLDDGSPWPGRARTWALTLTGAVLVFYAGVDVQRARIWKNDVTLWSDTVLKSPSSPTSHANLAWAYHRRGDVKDAAREYREVIKIGGEKTVEAMVNLGGIYLDARDYKNAIEMLAGAIERGASGASIHYNLATAYNGAKDAQGAIGQYKEVIRLDPGDDNAYYNLAWTYQSAGDNARAIYYYEQAALLAPGKADAHYNLGGIYESEGRFEDAAREYYAASRIDPGYRDVMARLENALRKSRAIAPGRPRHKEK